VCATGLLSQLNSCAPALPTFKTKISGQSINVPISFFETSNLAIVRDNQAEFDILLVKKNEELFEAIYMKCSHRENPLTATETGLYCSAHGSVFDLDGNVKKEPATAPLQKFPVDFDRTQGLISINIQSLKL
jgi:nitrite reductase/ring-hydroxylating ferredoxin subunit